MSELKKDSVERTLCIPLSHRKSTVHIADTRVHPDNCILNTVFRRKEILPIFA